MIIVRNRFLFSRVNMKRKYFLALLFGLLLQTRDIFAQQQIVASKQNATYEEVVRRVAVLVSSKGEENRALLNQEAEAMARRTDNEDMIVLASRLYEGVLNDKEMARNCRNLVIEKFPNGKTARELAFNEIFRSDNKDMSAAKMDQQYRAWLQKFPPAGFSKSDQMIYASAVTALAVQYSKENNLKEAVALMKSTSGSQMYVSDVSALYNRIATGQRNDPDVFILVKDAYEVANADAASLDADKKNGSNARYANVIAPVYAELLSQNGRYAGCIEVMSTILNATKFEGPGAEKNTRLVAECYIRLGRPQEALATFEKFTIANGETGSIVQEMKKLYAAITGSKADFNLYLAGIHGKVDQSFVSRYASDMVKKEAPAFSLVDNDGKTVSLSDYKGKVVVLDFWATWCVPCLASFPGMQAAQNKYAKDPDVAFLFIDTYERVNNYKEKAAELMLKQGYKFHVLFDEMKALPKATVTAYGIYGIPTKVIIDKNGYIRFQAAGTDEGAEKLVQELEVMISLVKKSG